MMKEHITNEVFDDACGDIEDNLGVQGGQESVQRCSFGLHEILFLSILVQSFVFSPVRKMLPFVVPAIQLNDAQVMMFLVRCRFTGFPSEGSLLSFP